MVRQVAASEEIDQRIEGLAGRYKRYNKGIWKQRMIGTVLIGLSIIGFYYLKEGGFLIVTLLGLALVGEKSVYVDEREPL